MQFGVSDDWDVRVPSWRARDVTREIDVVEEVGRAVLDRIPFTLPLRRHVRGRLTKDQRLRRLVEDVLIGVGFDEAYTWSLAAGDPDPGAIRLPDPMTSDQAVLRTTLLPGLVEAAQVQLDAGAERIALFEIARVYLPSGEQLPEERWRVGGIVVGGYAPAKGAVEAIHDALHIALPFEREVEPGPLFHPGKTARTPAGILGELHPALLEGSWGAFELDLATLVEAAPERVEYEDVITFPALRQDLAVAVPEDVEAGALVAAAKEAAGPELRDVRIFDVYRGEQVGEGRKSVALHLSFQSPERTLSDDDAAASRERIVAALAERFGAELRRLDDGRREPVGERLEHAQLDPRRVVEQRAEARPRDHEQVGRDGRRHRRRPRRARDQRDLAEEVAGAEHAHLPAAAMHLGVAVEDHEELVAAIPFPREHLARLDVDLVGDLRDLVHLGPAELAEERRTLRMRSILAFLPRRHGRV